MRASTATQAEADLLMRVRDALEEVPGAGMPLDAQDIQARAEHFRARLEYAMARQATLRPAGPDGTGRAVPRIRHAFIPVGACWLNLQEGWWRIFRETALAGRSFANPDDITQVTAVATQQLNARA
ncbi:hypothetical protein [Streptomyces sp. NPDC007206]|uniref:hypothetical protein n=1 Tax=Streptomyces sp. NPDC007206 TaxID=3154317 RepID=UPI0033F0A1EB